MPASLQFRKRLIAILWRIAASIVGVVLVWHSNKNPSSSRISVPLVVALGVFAIMRAAPSMPTDVSSSTPRALLRADRASAMGLAINHSVTGPRRWCLEAVVLLPIVLIVTWDEHAGARATSLMVWILVLTGVAVVTFMYGLTNTAWGRYRIAHIALACSRRLPWQTMAFLEDAHSRGILRQSGGTFQFRHARLQNHLSQRTGSDPGRRRSRVSVPAPVVLGVRSWPAPALAGFVLLCGGLTLEEDIGQIPRPAGPYAAPPAACSLLDSREVSEVIQGPPQKDAADSSGFPVNTWPLSLLYFQYRHQDAWCSWHNPSNGRKLAIATWTGFPTGGASGSRLALTAFSEGIASFATASEHSQLIAAVTKAAPVVPCDWDHEYSYQSSDPDGGSEAAAILLCQNVVVEVDYSSDRSDVGPSELADLAKKLIRLVLPRALPIDLKSHG